MSQHYIPRWPPFTFGGVENPRFKDAEVVIIPVPFDSTASYRPGSRDGPESIIDASRNMELFDRETRWSPVEIGIHTMAGIEPDRSDSAATIKRVQRVAAEAFRNGKFPVTLGGEHTIAVGPVAAAADAFAGLRVLVLDAHADMRDEYEGSGYSHACTNRRLSEIVEQVITAGVRSCSEEEYEHIQQRGLDVHFWTEGDRASGLESLSRAFDKVQESPEAPVYVSIDLDVFNPSELPAVGTPEPSGPTYDDLLPLLRELARRTNLIGLDVVELTPIPGDVRSEFMAARLIYKILGYKYERPQGRKRAKR